MATAKTTKTKAQETSEKKSNTKAAADSKEKKAITAEMRKQILHELLEQGKKNGELTYNEIAAKCEALEMDVDQIEKI